MFLGSVPTSVKGFPDVLCDHEAVLLATPLPPGALDCLGPSFDHSVYCFHGWPRFPEAKLGPWEVTRVSDSPLYPNANQVFQVLASSIDEAYDGVRVCVFAYTSKCTYTTACLEGIVFKNSCERYCAWNSLLRASLNVDHVLGIGWAGIRFVW